MDELQGIVKGLVDIAQGQIKAQKELSENTSHYATQLLTSAPRFVVSLPLALDYVFHLLHYQIILELQLRASIDFWSDFVN